MELPEELMTLILSKLPVKSVLRFKCVQKSWYSLINSPQFIRLHRSSLKKNDCFIVCRFIERQQNVLSLHSYENLEDLGNQINIPFSSNAIVNFCGSCDGLVCLSNYYDQIVICNPTIRELRPLFVPPFFCKKSNFLILSVAFGSDPNTGKYTVVMIGVPISDNDDDNYDPYYYEDPEARLYDFSTDFWRETANAFPPGPFDYLHCAISLNGAFHWCPRFGSNSNILTFQMSKEVTGSIPLPDFSVDVNVCYRKELRVSSKSQLSLILYDYEKGYFEICVMTEYGVNESWARLFKLPLKVSRPFLEFWDEQRLLLRSVQGQLVSLDLQHNQNLRHFPNHGYFDVYRFCHSLVSVNGIGKSVV